MTLRSDEEWMKLVKRGYPHLPSNKHEALHRHILRTHPDHQPLPMFENKRPRWQDRRWKLLAAGLLLLLLAIAGVVHARAQTGASEISVIQFQQDGVTFHTFAAPFRINCVTSLTCSVSGNVLSMHAIGGGGSMTWPAAAGIAVCTGTPCTAWGTSLVAPTGALVGTTDTQTLTSKTVDGVSPTTFGYLDPTSSVQTQLNGKQATLTNPVLGPGSGATVGHMATMGNTSGTAITDGGAIPTLGSLAGVATSTTVNGHALSSNVTVSASDVTTGTLPHAQLPALLSGDIPNNAANTSGSAGSFTGSLAGDVTGTQSATVVGKINGVSMAGLATGIVKNTTTTGVPSIAVAGDFPTLNQNTSGSAASLSAALALSGLATQAADTVVQNASGSTAVPTAVAVPSCSAASSALTYNTSTHAWGCNTISGSGNTTSTSLTTNKQPKANGANSLIDSLATDNGTTETYTGTGGMAATAFTSTGTTAGFFDYPAGSTSAGVAPCNTATSWCVQAPTSLSSNFVETLPTPSTGLMLHTLSGSTITDTIIAAPTGTILGTTDAQTITGKNIAASQLTGTYPILPSSMVARITTADVTCGTGGTISSCVSATTITGLTFALPAVAASYGFECDLIVGQATAATANQWLVQTATNGATNMMLAADIRTASATSALLVTTGQGSTTTAVEIGGATWTLAATGTKMLHRLYGTIEGASASGSTLNFQVIAPTVADLLTIYRGSSCRIF